MQEKIRKIIDNHFGATDSVDQDVANAAAEIATLFERKVIWEGEGQLLHELAFVTAPQEPYTVLDIEGCQFALGSGHHYGKHRQRVRVIVEEIDESE